VRVLPQTDPGEPITVHTPLRIEFSYQNYVPGTVLNVSMILNNLEEVCVFASPSDFAPRPAGLIRHTAEIPGDFLNAGSYYINMLIVKDASTGILFHNNVVAFDVVEGEVVGNWYGGLPGAVRPQLKWVSEAIETGDFAVSTARDRNT
jgi:lipopolysaccharide transport system ATP-binding protein